MRHSGQRWRRRPSNWSCSLTVSAEIPAREPNSESKPEPSGTAWKKALLGIALSVLLLALIGGVGALVVAAGCVGLCATAHKDVTDSSCRESGMYCSGQLLRDCKTDAVVQDCRACSGSIVTRCRARRYEGVSHEPWKGPGCYRDGAKVCEGP